MSDEPVEYGLEMAFVVCRSQGGPFDDDAFVAGYRCAMVDCMLADPAHHPGPVFAREGELAQCDLIAMRHGYTMTSEAADDEWFNVTFVRGVPS